MLYSEIKRETLSHINQYSVAGAPVAASYNNQADYLNRIPIYINEALVNILTLVKRDPVVYPLTGVMEYGDMLRYTLPDDFYALRTGGVTVLRGGECYTAFALAVEEDFTLRVRRENGEEECLSAGEVSVRGLMGYQ